MRRGKKRRSEEKEIVGGDLTRSNKEPYLLAGFSVFPPHPDNTQIDTEHEHRALLLCVTKIRPCIML